MIKKLIPKSIKLKYRHYLADVYILSYPKSGRTWLRMLIGTVLDIHLKLGINDKQKAALLRLTKSLKTIPTIHLSHDDDPGVTPYQELSINKDKFRNKKIILMIRDPRDVVVSAYYQYKLRDSREDIQNATISDFLKGDIGGMNSIIKYLNSWATQIPLHPHLFILRYEDLKRDGIKTLKEVTSFLGLEVSDECLQTAIEQNDFARLKKKEKQGELDSHFFGSSEKGDGGSKVRKGKIGGYKDELDKEHIEWMNQLINSKLSDQFDYYKY